MVESIPQSRRLERDRPGSLGPRDPFGSCGCRTQCPANIRAQTPRPSVDGGHANERGSDHSWRATVRPAMPPAPWETMALAWMVAAE
jgi:hypothetical protein